jgi:peptidyl-prolyl cis-trans isomerase D
MAVIGRIRQRSGLLIFLIGASIVGFLIMDATNSQFSVLRGRKDSIGKVNGQKISYNDFNKKYEEDIKNVEDQMRGQPIPDEQRNIMRNQTWNELVNDIIFNDIYAKLGITVTPEELNELVAGSPENVHPYVRQSFSNPQTRQFDPNQVRLFLQHLDEDEPGAEPGTRRKQWLSFESQLKKSEYVQKYNNLITKAFYIPGWMAEMAYNDQNRFVDFKYVQFPYTDVNDADIKVSDDELKKYISGHEAQYKQDEETRRLQYVSFDIIPSERDSAKTFQWLTDKRDDFAKAEKPSDDSVFLKLYSETPFDEVYYEKDKLNSPVKDSFFIVKERTIVGPYLDGKYYKLAKVSARKMISDSVRVRSIKISFNGVNSQEAANAKFLQADSIYKQIDSLKGDFGAFAAAFSDDEASKTRGGDMGWVKQGDKDKALNNLIFYRAQKGKLYKFVSQTENALYLLQVTEEKPSKMGVQVSYLSKEIVPSPETEKSIYNNAISFAADNQSQAKYKASAQKLNAKTVSEVKKDAFTLQGLGNARDVIKWAFNAKKGDVSPAFTVEKKYVVALVEDIRPKGLPDVDAVRDLVKAQVVKEKKVELLSKKINDLKAGSVDDLAGKTGKLVMEAPRASFGNPSMNGMAEPKVVAAALGTAAGKLSQPVSGNAGVYVVQTISVQEPPKASDYSMYSYQLQQQYGYKSRYAQEVEKKLAKIEDNRFDFF